MVMRDLAGRGRLKGAAFWRMALPASLLAFAWHLDSNNWYWRKFRKVLGRYKVLGCEAEDVYGFLLTGATVSPHPEKAYKGGEDAFGFRARMITVADGVGGWADEGVDVAKYSKQLMKFICESYDKNSSRSPKEILTDADKLTTETGTSTAVIAILKPRTKTIATTLLGDSAYMIIRPNKDSRIDKLYRSIEQQHYFDCPFQCGTRGDNPSKARDEEHSVLHNDILVMGTFNFHYLIIIFIYSTDGVWDNCFDKELIDIIKLSIDSNGNLIDPQNVSKEIAKLAEIHGADKQWRSPFEVSSEEAPDSETKPGGKQDDIAVIVSQVKID